MQNQAMIIVWINNKSICKTLKKYITKYLMFVHKTRWDFKKNDKKKHIIIQKGRKL
jgi:hypothetical protein